MKEVIENSGLKLREFAEKYEIPYNTVRQWYNGEREPAKWIKKLISEKIVKTDARPKKQPKYVYVFMNKLCNDDVIIRRFTNEEDVTICKDKFWKNRYINELETPNRKLYRYKLSEETLISES